MDVAALSTAAVLVANAGSSTVKLRLLDQADRVVASRDLPAIGDVTDSDVAAAIAALTRDAGTGVDVVAHRVVHGGSRYRGPVLLDAGVRADLDALVELAPLHQPKSLRLVAMVDRALPDVPAVACFDTAFHATLPPHAYTYAVPEQWRERWGVRRYGFHGLSHAYAARRAAELVPGELDALRVVSCHLGAGASLAAVVGGRSVDTTMGFTPLDGLVMATRCGALDPGVVLWLEEHERLSPREVLQALEHESGLAGLAGTPDLAAVEARARSGDAAASLALEVYVHRLVTSIGAMAAAAGGLDVLVFTGGVGENSATVRAHAALRLAHLGVAVDAAVNAAASGDTDISAPDARVRTYVIAAREDLQMAAEARHVLAARERSAAQADLEVVVHRPDLRQ